MWMAIMAIGAALGLAALGGIVWALRKLRGQKKWGALVAFLLLGAGGGFMVVNATALTAPPGDGAEDFDPDAFDEEPLGFDDEDWGEDDDWADEAGDELEEAGEEVGEAVDEATE